MMADSTRETPVTSLPPAPVGVGIALLRVTWAWLRGTSMIIAFIVIAGSVALGLPGLVAWQLGIDFETAMGLFYGVITAIGCFIYFIAAPFVIQVQKEMEESK